MLAKGEESRMRLSSKASITKNVTFHLLTVSRHGHPRNTELRVTVGHCSGENGRVHGQLVRIDRFEGSNF